jgi:hypothetical protein
MALFTTLSNQIRPEALRRYEAAVQRLAEAARKAKEKLHWTAYQTVFGSQLRFHFSSSADTFRALEERGTVPELAGRVLGNGALAWLDEIGACTVDQRFIVSTERADLSYRRSDLTPAQTRAASVSRLHARLGARESAEELIRKLAEAIPKVDDPTSLITRQVLVGNVAEYILIRPLRSLADLDAQRSPEQLLTQAFGAGEGGLVFRAGGDALESVEREIVVYREDLSNAAA